MKLKLFLVLAIVVISIGMFGCGGPTTPVNSNTPNTNSNANVPKENINSAVQTTTPVPEQTTNNAPTLTPVFKAYCAAMVKKDEAAIRKFYTSGTLKNFEEQMKDSDIKSLIKFLEDDQISEKLCEVRNEVITGDTAVAEIRTTGYPTGMKIIFEKENGEWKLTNKSPNIDAVRKAAANSNSAK